MCDIPVNISIDQATRYTLGFFEFTEVISMPDIKCIVFNACLIDPGFRFLLKDIETLEIEQITLDLNDGKYHLETNNGDELAKIGVHKVVWHQSAAPSTD